MLTMASFLALMVAPSARAEDLPGDLQCALVLVTGLAQLDEVGVLGKAAGVDEERDAKFAVGLSDAPQVLHGNRLASAGVVGDRDHPKGDILRSHFLDEGAQLLNVHVAFERMAVGGIARLR